MGNALKKMWKWIDHNRFFVIGPIVGILIGIYAISCTPVVSDPTRPGSQVNARQLQSSFETWQAEQQVITKQFELAGNELEYQAEQNKKIEDLIIKIVSGGVADLPGLLQLAFAGGALGAITDNIRKRGVISGLKRNS